MGLLNEISTDIDFPHQDDCVDKDDVRLIFSGEDDESEGFIRKYYCDGCGMIAVETFKSEGVTEQYHESANRVTANGGK